MNHREKGGSLKNIIHWATHARFVEIFLRFLHGSFLTRLDDLHFGHSNLFRISYFSAKRNPALPGRASDLVAAMPRCVLSASLA